VDKCALFDLRDPVAPDSRIVSCVEGTEDRRWRTDRDGENRFTTQVAFTRAGEDLLRNGGRGFVSATLPDGTIIRDEPALRALIAASAVGR
jgi:hypothetical protein